VPVLRDVANAQSVVADELPGQVAVEGDAVLRLDGGGVTQIMERVAPLRPVFEAAATEPGVTEVWANAERLRLDGYRAIIDLLASKQPLAAGLTPGTAADVLFVLLGPDTFRAFTHGRGWPLEQWRAWVTTTLERDLFTCPASRSA
jgi:hypothetical protein